MLKAITNNEQLKPFFKDDIKENRVCVILDDSFYLTSKKLNTKSLVNIAVDDFYNGLNLAKTPPSIDNLLIINRGDSKFSLYLIELKKRKRTRHIFHKEIQSKFKTTIDNFMSERFSREFVETAAKTIDLNLWFVCNLFLSEGTGLKSMKSQIIEKLMSIKPFEFRGKKSMIRPMPSGERIS